MKILLVGDIMLDKNIHTSSNRNCPEDKKLPVCNVLKDNYLLGGCANVGVNLANFGHEVHLLSYIGKDKNSIIIKDLLDKYNIYKTYLIKLDRPTITKNRIFLNNKLICRFDEEDSSDVDFSYFDIKNCFKEIKFDMIVISDYAKGVINKSGLAKFLISESNKYNIPIIIDPKPNNIEFYKNSTIIKANFEEISNMYYQSTKEKIKLNEEHLEKASRFLSQKFNIKYLITSLASEGIYIFNKDDNSGFQVNKKYIKQEDVVDVTGAGDVVISILTHYFPDIKRGCFLANKIAQNSVLQLGVKYLNYDDLKEN